MIRRTFTFTGAGEDFGPRADGLVTAHTTESPFNRLTVADAIILARWQDRADIAGSYGDLICIDGILQCVPPSHASGGINPASAFFNPEPWLFDVMSREMVFNPNFFTRNVSFMGDRAWFDANGWPPQMIDNFVTVMLEEERRIKSRTILTDHEDFQTNRSDAGPIANKLIRARYAARTQEDPMAIAELRRQLEEARDRIEHLLRRKGELEARRDALTAEINTLEAEVARLEPTEEAVIRLRRRIRRIKELVAAMAAEMEEV